MARTTNRGTWIAASSAVAAVIAVTSMVYAHGGATGIVKQRMDAMEVMGKAMKSVGAMFKGQADYDPAEIEAAAGLIAQHARDIPALFPDSMESRHGKATEALPVIWEQKDRFDGLAVDMLQEAEALGALAPDGDKRAVRLQFTKTAKVCSACHTAYRKPEE